MTDAPDDAGDDPDATEYDELVRDRIPELVRADGETPVTREVGGEEYERYLAAKLEEEAAEFAEARDPAELADVLAVVEALAALDGLDRGAVDRLRREKRDERGGFAEGVVLERVVHAPPDGRDGDADGPD